MSQHFTGAHIEAVAHKLLGEPNREKSTKHQLRFGNQGSMAVEIGGNKAGTWYDFENKVGGGVMELIKRETGLVNGAAFDWLRDIGIEVGPVPQTDRGVIATYDYTDADGKPLFQVVRYAPKRFVQRRRADDERWVWGLKAGRYWLSPTGWKVDKGNIPPGAEVRHFPECPRVPYRLPELTRAVAKGKTIWIPEGEKDVDNLRSRGLVATCNPGGAGKWRDSFRQYFHGARVVVLPDNDEAGRTHGPMVVDSLLLVAEWVRRLDLPGLPDRGDVSNWLEAGGTIEALQEMAGRVPVEQALRSNVNAPPDQLNGAREPACEPRHSVQHLSIGSDVEIAGRVQQDLVDRFGEIVNCEGAFWRYVGTHWEAIADEELWLAVFAYDGALFETPKGEASAVKLNKSRIESTLACMKPDITRPDFFAKAAVGINCASGFIRFDDHGTPTLEPHSSDHRCRHVLPGRWPLQVSPDQKRQSLRNQLLSGCFRGDPDKNKKIALLAEVAGVAALGYATKLTKPKALVLKGETAENGKSQVLDCMRALLPKEAVSSISPAWFDDRTFTCHLVGKLLNAPDELGSTDDLASEVFKQIITGDPLTVRDVYKSAFDFRPLAQHVYATNNLPTFKGGMDRGVRRRLMVLTFNRVIPEAERIEHMGLRIGREEPDLLLDFAVRGARRVIRKRSFTEPASSKEALAEWMYSSDPVLGWLESDRVCFGNGKNIPEIETRIAYRYFTRRAIDEGFSDKTLPAINGFVQRVVAAGKGITKKRDMRRRYFKGLACTDGHLS